jgi:hypothetical protein
MEGILYGAPNRKLEPDPSLRAVQSCVPHQVSGPSTAGAGRWCVGRFTDCCVDAASVVSSSLVPPVSSLLAVKALLPQW